MEEILASIRRIISEDEASTGSRAAVSPASEEVLEDDGSDDVLILTERAPAEDAGSPPSPPVPSPRAAETPVTQSAGPDHGAVAPETARRAAASFDKLALVADSARTPSPLAVSANGPTLEDMTRELLKPVLKAWLDENLAAIVQARVDEEVERIARGRVR